MTSGALASSSAADEIDDAEEIYRRLPGGSALMLVINAVNGERRPSSAAFKPNSKRDPDGLSVFRQRVLDAAGLSAASVTNGPDDAVAGLTAGVPRSVGLGVVADPQPDEAGVHARGRGLAHALINGWPTKRSGVDRCAKHLALAAVLVIDA